MLSANPESSKERAHRPLTRFRDQCALVFTIVAAVLTTLQSPVAWIAWSITAYYAAVYGACAIVWGPRPTSNLTRALVVGATLISTGVGTWFAHDGIMSDKTSSQPEGRSLLSAVGRLEASLNDDLRMLQAEVVLVAMAELQPGDTSKSEPQASTLKTEVNMHVSGKHASASVSVEATSQKRAPMATAARGTKLHSTGAATPGGGGTAAPVEVPSMPSEAHDEASPDETLSAIPAEIPAVSPSESNDTSDGETPAGPVLQTGGTAAP